jgi:hypothetical protein
MTSGKYSATWFGGSGLLLSGLLVDTKAGEVGFNISAFKINLKKIEKRFKMQLKMPIISLNKTTKLEYLNGEKIPEPDFFCQDP